MLLFVSILSPFFMQDLFNQVLFIFTNVSIKSLRHQIRPNLIDMFETLMSFFEYRCLRGCSCLEKFQKILNIFQLCQFNAKVLFLSQFS